MQISPQPSTTQHTLREAQDADRLMTNPANIVLAAIFLPVLVLIALALHAIQTPWRRRRSRALLNLPRGTTPPPS